MRSVERRVKAEVLQGDLVAEDERFELSLADVISGEGGIEVSCSVRYGLFWDTFSSFRRKQ